MVKKLLLLLLLLACFHYYYSDRKAKQLHTSVTTIIVFDGNVAAAVTDNYDLNRSVMKSAQFN